MVNEEDCLRQETSTNPLSPFPRQAWIYVNELMLFELMITPCSQQIMSIYLSSLMYPNL